MRYKQPMTTIIHTTALIEPGATLGQGTSVGAYSIIGPQVKIGANVRIEAHVVIGGDTTIGDGCHIFPFTSLGLQPQDLKFHGEKTTLVIGKHNTIREHVTMNPGTEGGGGITKVGDNCLFMVGTHVAHDCQVGNHVILANNATLAGHVHVGDHAIIGGLSAVHQFVRIGHHAMIGGMSGIEADVVPYALAMGERANLAGLNLTGLKRRNFSREDIHTLRGAYRMLFSTEGTLEERIADVEEQFGDNTTVREILNFIRSETSRALCQPKATKAA